MGLMIREGDGQRKGYTGSWHNGTEGRLAITTRHCKDRAGYAPLHCEKWGLLQWRFNGLETGTKEVLQGGVLSFLVIVCLILCFVRAKRSEAKRACWLSISPRRVGNVGGRKFCCRYIYIDTRWLREGIGSWEHTQVIKQTRRERQIPQSRSCPPTILVICATAPQLPCPEERDTFRCAFFRFPPNIRRRRWPGIMCHPNKAVPERACFLERLFSP